MKISKANWHSHEVLGDLELNFKEGDWAPYGTVIFAGENGSGKTTILESLFKYFSAHPLMRNVNQPTGGMNTLLSMEIDFDANDNIQDEAGAIAAKAETSTDLASNGATKTQFYDSNNTEIKIADKEYTTARAAYSQVAINFNSKGIKATTDKGIDTNDNKSEKSAEDLATEITQLLLDIHKEDSAELSQWVKKNPGIAPPEHEQEKRLKRFTNAFKLVFGDRLIFKGVEGLKVLFEKNGQEIPIDQLSSGEKQIVFRGGFLLRNLGTMNGTIVLIDEPEISMHPKWQEMMFDFYRALFMDETGKQTSQLFIATHSDHILKRALECENTVVILLKDGEPPEYVHKGNRGMVLKTVTLAEVKWRIFDLPTTDFHDQLWAELSYDDVNNVVKNVPTLDAELITAAGSDTLKLKSWTGYQKDSAHPDGRRLNSRGNTSSLPTYIRNYIHHPEFTNINNVSDNDFYTDDELRLSIQFMIDTL